MREITPKQRARKSPKHTRYQYLHVALAANRPERAQAEICGFSPCGIDAQLYKVPEVVAIKEATGSVDFATEIRSLCDIQIFSGDDSLTVPLMSVGAKGVVSVTANLAPKQVMMSLFSKPHSLNPFHSPHPES